MCSSLENNNLTGGLSSTWAAPGVFQSLTGMDLSGNWYLNGILLSQWGTPGAFPMLQVSLPAICLQLILLEGLLEAARFSQIDSMHSKSVSGA